MNKPLYPSDLMSDVAPVTKPEKRRNSKGGLCAKCRKYPAMPKQCYCLNCHAAYQRHWRKTHPLSLEAQVKNAVRAMTKEYIRKGYIEREPCQVCGAWAETHHPDYSKPFDVMWLCHDHHVEEHRRLRAEAKAAA